MCGFEGMWKDNARVAQLVEYNLAKVGVAGSSPVSRSQEYKKGYPFRIPFLVLFKPCRARTFEVSAPVVAKRTSTGRSATSRALLKSVPKPVFIRVSAFFYLKTCV